MKPLEPAEAAILLSLDPLFRPFVLALKAQYPECPLTSGYRPVGYERILLALHQHPDVGEKYPELAQTTMVAQHPENSKHPRQFACDFDVSGLGKLEVVNFGMAAEKLGLIWGGRFTDTTHPVGGADNGHVEAPFDDATLDAYRLVTGWSL